MSELMTWRVNGWMGGAAGSALQDCLLKPGAGWIYCFSSMQQFSINKSLARTFGDITVIAVNKPKMLSGSVWSAVHETDR